MIKYCYAFLVFAVYGSTLCMQESQAPQAYENASEAFKAVQYRKKRPNNNELCRIATAISQSDLLTKKMNTLTPQDVEALSNLRFLLAESRKQIFPQAGDNTAGVENKADLVKLFFPDDQESLGAERYMNKRKRG